MSPVPTLLRAEGIEATKDDPRYSALWMFVDTCQEPDYRFGHWSLRVITQGQETLYTVVGHRGNYALQIVNGITPGLLDQGLLLPVAAVDADGLRAHLASVKVKDTGRDENSQHWVWDVLESLLPREPSSRCPDETFIELLAITAWMWAGEV